MRATKEPRDPHRARNVADRCETGAETPAWLSPASKQAQSSQHMFGRRAALEETSVLVNSFEDLQDRKIDFTNSKTLVDVATDRDARSFDLPECQVFFFFSESEKKLKQKNKEKNEEKRNKKTGK